MSTSAAVTPASELFGSLESFYDADPRRRQSGECDYGVWWTIAGHPPFYRVSYVRATGEVYCLNLSSREVKVVGIVKPNKGRNYHRRCDFVLLGWAEGPQTIGWLTERLSPR